MTQQVFGDDRDPAGVLLSLERARLADDWEALKRDYPTWELFKGGSAGTSGPGTWDYRARRGAVSLIEQSIPALRRQLGAQPAQPMPPEGA